jgi:hypothetical protein
MCRAGVGAAAFVRMPFRKSDVFNGSLKNHSLEAEMLIQLRWR